MKLALLSFKKSFMLEREINLARIEIAADRPLNFDLITTVTTERIAKK